MKTTVEKAWLIRRVQGNREEHRSVFLKAMEGFRKKAIQLFEEQIDRAKRGKRFDAYVHLVQPIDQTKEYDRTLAMLEAETGATVELTEQDFARYVQDEWDWKQNFTNSTAAYMAQPEN
jgi:hypothetical protein